jgi:ribonucleotide reductase beta subunit family protein with ferritin-like domain
VSERRKLKWRINEGMKAHMAEVRKEIVDQEKAAKNLKKFDRWTSFIKQRNKVITEWYKEIKRVRSLERFLKRVTLHKIIKHAAWCIKDT